MNSLLIFVPILVHFVLVIALYTLLLLRKLKAKDSEDLDLKAVALNCKAWPDDVLKVSNNLDNQFQAPILFYMLCGVLYVAQGVNTCTLILAWLFVFSRYFHSYVHAGRNYVPHRMKVFSVGIITLVMMAGMAAFYLWLATSV